MNGFPLIFFFFNFADEPDIKGVCPPVCLSLILLKALIRWWYFGLTSILCHISNELELHVLESMLHCFEFFFSLPHLHFLPVSSLLSSFTLWNVDQSHLPCIFLKAHTWNTQKSWKIEPTMFFFSFFLHLDWPFHFLKCCLAYTID